MGEAFRIECILPHDSSNELLQYYEEEEDELVVRSIFFSREVSELEEIFKQVSDFT